MDDPFDQVDEPADAAEAAEIAWERTLWDSPPFVRNTLMSMVQRGLRGDRDAIERLNLSVEWRPQYRAIIEELGGAKLLTSGDSGRLRADQAEQLPSDSRRARETSGRRKRS